MSDPPVFNPGFAETPTPYVSASQSARVFTEAWAAIHLFCPHCGAARVSKYANNRPVADFYCSTCGEQFELKAKNGRVGPKVADGAFAAKCARLASDTSPNLVVLAYSKARFEMTVLFFVPKQYFVREIIEARPPLAATARRAGWVGSNILIGKVPEAGKIWMVRDGEAVPRDHVRAQWRATLFLRDERPAARGWLIDVMKCVERVGAREFSLDDVYAFEGELSGLYPGNRNVRPKIRQQLQVLRDRGYLQFVGRGRYRVGFAG